MLEEESYSSFVQQLCYLQGFLALPIGKINLCVVFGSGNFDICLVGVLEGLIMLQYSGGKGINDTFVFPRVVWCRIECKFKNLAFLILSF